MKYIVTLALVGLLAASAVARAQSPSDEVVRLEAQLSTLRQTYTDRHPAVMATVEELQMARYRLRSADNVAELQAQLSALRQTYTDLHPEVRSVIARVAELKEAASLLQSERDELARLRLTYSEQHPVVQAQLAKIRTLQQR